MLRPATPLAVLFFAAFVLLLLSTLSTPVIKAIPLASFKGTTFGVWGFCGPNNCSDIAIGYSTGDLTEGSSSSDFSLPTATRHSLSSILIVHPVAAFLCLVCFALSVAAHFHSPSHSPRYLLALLIFTIPTVLVTLLAFLVDILVFVPHVSWGGWIVLGSTILIMVSMVLTCAMRRTLVSRKARKKRIAENAEMSGQNYYEQRAQTDIMMERNAQADTSLGSYSVVNLPKAESPPPMPDNVSPISDKGAEYATFDLQKKMSEDRTPLNSSDSIGRSPSRDRNGQTNGGWRGPGMGAVNDPYGSRQDHRDQFGNALGPRNDQYDPYGGGMRGGPPSRGRNGAFSPMGPPGRGGGPPPFGGRGRGPGYGQGPPPGRGGFAPPRGGYGRGFPNRGGPGGYGGPGRGGPGMGRGGMPRGPMAPPPPGYNQQYFPGGPPQATSNTGTYGGPTMIGSDSARSLSPQGRLSDDAHAPIGQAIEMDDRTGLPSPVNSQPMNFGLRESDADVQGMVGMQQQRTSDDPSRVMSGSSMYSGNTEDRPYVPARAAWHDPSSSTVPTSSSLRTPATYSTNSGGYQPVSNHNLSPVAHSPIPLQQDNLRNANSYYEDTAPGFTSQPYSQQQQHLHPHQVGSDVHDGGHPLGTGSGIDGAPASLHPSLIPGPLQPSGTLATASAPAATSPSAAPPDVLRNNTTTNNAALLAPHPAAPLDRENSPASHSPHADGTRSPAISDSSHYTSISQRPVNPEWTPGPGSNGYAPRATPSRQQQRGEDVLLGDNPEFSVPGIGPGSRGRGHVRGPSADRRVYGMQPPGRYPGAI